MSIHRLGFDNSQVKTNYCVQLLPTLPNAVIGEPQCYLACLQLNVIIYCWFETNRFRYPDKANSFAFRQAVFIYAFWENFVYLNCETVVNLATAIGFSASKTLMLIF